MNTSEPSLLTYARLHGLTRPPSPGNPQIFLDAGTVQAPSELGYHDDEAILQGLAGTSPSSERPSLDQTDRDFLASIVALRIGGAKTPDHESLFAGRQYRVDSPLLYTDHELDVILHCKARGGISKFPARLAEPITSDRDKDEALDWPSWSLNAPITYEHACQMEKLQVPQKALMLLKSAIHGSPVAHYEDEYLYAYNKVCLYQRTKCSLLKLPRTWQIGYAPLHYFLPHPNFMDIVSPPR